MMHANSIVIIAMAYGGLMQKTGQIEALVSPLVSHVKSRGGLTALTAASCVCMNVILPDQYLGISVPGQMYAEEYDRRGMSRVDLSRALLCGGAVLLAARSVEHLRHLLFRHSRRCHDELSALCISRSFSPAAAHCAQPWQFTFPDKESVPFFCAMPTALNFKPPSSQ